MSLLLRLVMLTSLWLLGATVYAQTKPQPALTLTIIPTSYTTYSNQRSPQATISLEGDNSHFHVLLTNKSAKPVTIFEEWNSWGYFGLSFDITYPDGHKMHTVKAAQEWFKNAPTTTTIVPNGFYVFDVTFDTTWVNSIRRQPALPQGNACRLRAIYSIAPTKSLPLALDKRVVKAWTGTVKSAELPYIIWL